MESRRIDPHSYYDANQPSIRHVKLDWVVDFDNKILKCRADYRLADPTHRIDLDTRDLNILTIIVPGGCLWHVDQRDPILGSRLKIVAPPGEPDFSEFTIHYETIPESTALLWLEPEQTFSKKHPFVFSQCQPIHARSLIPIQDTPSVRFTYEATIRVPQAPLTAVMAAEMESIFSHREEWKDRGYMSEFLMKYPIPSYLLAFAAGNISFRPTYYESRSAILGEPEILQLTAGDFRGFDTLLNIAQQLLGPYRWDDYEVMLMPPAFPYGGMENPMLTFLSPTLLTGDGSSQIHELAHSWAGNLVTNATWQDFWLNEGLTRYIERRIIEELEGRDAAILHADLGRINLDDAIEDFKKQGRFELTCLKTNLAGIHPDEAFSSVPYEKGYLLFVVLEDIVERYRLDHFLRLYFDRFAFQSISTEDFLEFLDTELPGVRETALVDQWIYAPGIPENAIYASSEKLSTIRHLAENWRPSRVSEIQHANWGSLEWRVFLNYFASTEFSEIKHLDDTFNLSEHKDMAVQAAWLSRCIMANYLAKLPLAEELVKSTGRALYLSKIYKAMINNGFADIAHRWYAESCSQYHEVTRIQLEKIFRQ